MGWKNWGSIPGKVKYFSFLRNIQVGPGSHRASCSTRISNYSAEIRRTAREAGSSPGCTRWFKYDRDDLCVNKSQFVPVIFEPPCNSEIKNEPGNAPAPLFAFLTLTATTLLCKLSCISTYTVNGITAD